LNMEFLSETQSALNVHVPGTIGTFRVSKGEGGTTGVEVRYLLTHVTLSDKQGPLLDMLAPVREVFDLKQLGFDEIMQRDIDDARVSLELIPYLLDTSNSGQIKLFPPIVAIVLPLRATSNTPDALYRKVSTIQKPTAREGYKEIRVTAGAPGEEQFEFLQYYKNDVPLTSDGAKLSLARDNCALAIVDGQHRAMALLALYRNLKSGWTDAKRAPYKGYYQVWSDKEIRKYNLSELQLPLIICTFPQLDGTNVENLDVVRAARKVFLTLNKTAKKVSDSRNKLLNDQDLVAECLRETLSSIKKFDIKDQTGLRIWNVELDQEGDRTKIVSEVAFSGVSHLYHFTDHLLMSNSPVRSLEARGKVGRPPVRLDVAFQRLGLKDSLTADKREANTRTNYSDEVCEVFRSRWQELYGPVIEEIYGKFFPFSAFSSATLKLYQDLIGDNESTIEKMLFDGQATARTFDDFREGLTRRIKDPESGWSSPEIAQALAVENGRLSKRNQLVEEMRVNRAKNFLGQSNLRRVTKDGQIAQPVREVVDKLFDSVFSTVAFQTALICTYVEAVQEALGSIDQSTPKLLSEYLCCLDSLFAPANPKDLQRLIQVFEGKLEFEPKVEVVVSPAFRGIVLLGELQPAEWPKFRYLLIELWNSSSEKIQSLIDTDRVTGRKQVAKALYARRLRVYCEDKGIAPAALATDVRKEIASDAKSAYENLLQAVHGRKVSVAISSFEADSAQPTTEENAPVADGSEQP
jgi:hypothetical protein